MVHGDMAFGNEVNLPGSPISAKRAVFDTIRPDFIATQLNITSEERQKVLEELNLGRRFEIINRLLNREVEVLEIRQKIQSQAAGSMSSQRHNAK